MANSTSFVVTLDKCKVIFSKTELPSIEVRVFGCIKIPGLRIILSTVIHSKVDLMGTCY
jgi:hypothetical protein